MKALWRLTRFLDELGEWVWWEFPRLLLLASIAVWLVVGVLALMERVS